MRPVRFSFCRSDSRFMREASERSRLSGDRVMKTAQGFGEGSSCGQAAPLLPGLPDGLCCPNCRGPMGGHNTTARCGSCGRTVVVLGGRIPDFLTGENHSAGTIIGWSDGFVRNLQPWLLALASGQSVSADACAE